MQNLEKLKPQISANEKIESVREISSFEDLLPLSPKQIAIYGGSFDPPHLGHLACIENLARSNEVVVVMPLGKNPLKPNQPFASDKDRLEMLNLMLDGLNNVFICTEEIQRAIRTGNATKTIDTVRLAKKELPGAKIRLVMGADCLHKLHLWDHYQDIFKIAEPLVFSRPGYQPEGWQELIDRLGWNLVSRIREGLLESGSNLDVSSTATRQALAEDDSSLNRMLPLSVIAYIREKGMYGLRLTRNTC